MAVSTAGSSGQIVVAGAGDAELAGKAARILSDLGVQVRTNATIAAATEEGFRLTDGQLVAGGVFVRPLEAFEFHDEGFVVSAGTRRGVAGIAGITTGGHLVHRLKDAIEWEYRQSVGHLCGWDPVAR